MLSLLGDIIAFNNEKVSPFQNRERSGTRYPIALEVHKLVDLLLKTVFSIKNIQICSLIRLGFVIKRMFFLDSIPFYVEIFHPQ
jgi:hypothetical protein